MSARDNSNIPMESMPRPRRTETTPEPFEDARDKERRENVDNTDGKEDKEQLTGIAVQEEPMKVVNAKAKVGASAANTYAAKKTMAQGMMDIALMTSNANQLRYLVEYGNHAGVLFIMSVVLISISILLQVAVGMALIFKGRADLTGRGKSPQARRINNWVAIGVFIVTVINVFVASFTVAGNNSNNASTRPTGDVPSGSTA